MTSEQTIATYEDIDWHLLWQNARAKKAWKSKTSKQWNSNAASFSKRTRKSAYSDRFLALVDIGPETTVLDVGCGPGTLAVPIARKAMSVTAIDYASGMLEELENEARKNELSNIRSLKCAWEDDWEQASVGRHDIVIASRSMNIENLADGISKLNSHATHRVVISERIDPTPFDPDIFTALGRPFNSGPDYIYTLNTLYKLGIHPRIDHIELPAQTVYRNLQEAVDSYKWMLKDLSEREEDRLKKFVSSRIRKQKDGTLILKRRFPPRWAVLSYNTSPSSFLRKTTTHGQ